MLNLIKHSELKLVRLNCCLQIMKRLIFCLTVFSISCTVKNVNYDKKEAPVNIVSVSVSKTGEVSKPVDIKAVANANNGCWHNFKFTLRKLNDFEFKLNAHADFESKGFCAAVIVEKDTTISFIPDKKGRYIIHTNDTPFTILSDTVTVY